jgi:hypothetical protein
MAIPAVAAAASSASGGSAAGGAAAGSSGAAAGGSAAGGAAAGGSAKGVAANLLGSSGISIDVNAMLPWGWADKIYKQKLYANEAETEQQRFDAQFDEDKRRFGLNYALQQFSMRANMSFQEAQSLYQRQAGQVQQGMEYQNFAQGMKEKQAAFGWAKEDRATKKKFNDAFTRGLARGLKTGGK